MLQLIYKFIQIILKQLCLRYVTIYLEAVLLDKIPELVRQWSMLAAAELGAYSRPGSRCPSSSSGCQGPGPSARGSSPPRTPGRRCRWSPCRPRPRGSWRSGWTPRAGWSGSRWRWWRSWAWWWRPASRGPAPRSTRSRRWRRRRWPGLCLYNSHCNRWCNMQETLPGMKTVVQ